jgi:2-polyprenyl-6-methoxyphenol hydroxylase-like FAD-dependent oxidoreductase
MKDPAKVMVAGAGIGGLTAAIALRRAGFDVTVFEHTAELRDVGAGLLLAANAQKALGKLGLAEAVARLGTPASAGEIRSWRGEVLASIPAAEVERRVGAPSAAVHRADLQGLLVRADDGLVDGMAHPEIIGVDEQQAGIRRVSQEAVRWAGIPCAHLAISFQKVLSHHSRYTVSGETPRAPDKRSSENLSSRHSGE